MLPHANDPYTPTPTQEAPMPRRRPTDKKTERIQLHMTAAMYADLCHLAGSDNSGEVADVIRESINFYLDNHPRITGSEAHFTNAVERHFSRMEERLLKRLNEREDNIFEGLRAVFDRAHEDQHIVLSFLVATLYASGLAAHRSDKSLLGGGSKGREHEAALREIDIALSSAIEQQNIDILLEATRRFRQTYQRKLEKQRRQSK
jgi:hypothetical protein